MTNETQIRAIFVVKRPLRMETSRKTPYQSPTSTTIQVRTTGIVCTSGETDGGLSDYNKENSQTW